MKRIAYGALWLALSAQVAWFVLDGPPDAFGVTVVLVLAAFAVAAGRWPWLTVAVRLVMAADFLLSVGDRMGAFGPAGSGANWGDFDQFVAYTRSISTFLPAGWAPTLAVAATVAESALGLALLLGCWPRFAALGAAALVGAFGVSMTLSVPAAQQFHYCVFLLAAGMLALSTADRFPLSVLGRPAAPGGHGVTRLGALRA